MSDEKLIRANQAQLILNDPLFIEAFEGLEKGAIERLAACDVHDKDKLATLAMSLQTIRSVRRRFALWVTEGEAEAKKQFQREEVPSLIDRFRRRA